MAGRMPGRGTALTLISPSHAVNHSFWVLIPTLSPLILREYGLGFVGAGILFAVYLAAYSLGQLPIGLLANRVSRSLLMGAGLIVTAVGMALTTAAPSFELVLAFQALAGLGGAAHHPLALHLISDVFPPGSRGRALGIHGFASSVSFAVTPAVGVTLASEGWRPPLLFFSGFALLVGVLIAVLIRTEARRIEVSPLQVLRVPGFRRLLAYPQYTNPT